MKMGQSECQVVKQLWSCNSSNHLLAIFLNTKINLEKQYQLPLQPGSKLCNEGAKLLTSLIVHEHNDQVRSTTKNFITIHFTRYISYSNYLIIVLDSITHMQQLLPNIVNFILP